MKKELENLIAKGETHRAISIMLSVTEKSDKNDLRNQLIIISNQYQEFQRGKIIGIYDLNEHRRIDAQINLGLLAIIHKLDEVDLNNFNIGDTNTIKPSKRLNRAFIMVFTTIYFCFIFYFLGQKFIHPSNGDPQDSKNIDTIAMTDSNLTPTPVPIEIINHSGGVPSQETSNGPKTEEKPTLNPMTELRGRTVEVSGDSIKRFKIATHEVTVGQYLLFCKLTGNRFPKEVDTTNALVPITNVSWKEAKSYCDYVNGRLPTVEEWEFAAKGGSKSQQYLYSGSNDLNEVAWSKLHEDISNAQPVGKKKPNELGIFDMSGNVREWCFDEAEKPGYRYVKGGSWKSGSPQYYSPTHKLKPEPFLFKDATSGFRVVFDK